MAFETVEWRNGAVVLIDQLRLPTETIYRSYTDPEDVAVAIEKMIVRGAPAIGVTAALGLALAAQKLKSMPLDDAQKNFADWAARFSRTRPTAVNLFWAVEKMSLTSKADYPSTEAWAMAILKEAQRIRSEDIDACKKMGEFGAALVPKGARILTHCNAGALATAGWGTAVGVIRSAHAQGKVSHVWVDETRPFLQGARLTAWELSEAKIPSTLLTDNMAGHFISRKEVDLIVVGADRIAANGDVANKIGTYTLAVLAKENGIPFYVAAPRSTIDMNCRWGGAIPIEERSHAEVLGFGQERTAPTGFQARHPAFDVTPARYVTAIITEAGVAEPPFAESLARMTQD